MSLVFTWYYIQFYRCLWISKISFSEYFEGQYVSNDANVRGVLYLCRLGLNLWYHRITKTTVGQNELQI